MCSSLSYPHGCFLFFKCCPPFQARGSATWVLSIYPQFCLNMQNVVLLKGHLGDPWMTELFSPHKNLSAETAEGRGEELEEDTWEVSCSHL